MKTLILLTILGFIGGFSLQFHLDKKFDNSCYSDGGCYKDVMVREDRDNIQLSLLSAIIFPISIPINSYLLIKYK